MSQYDLCGLMSLVLLTGKIIMQNIAGLEHKWDEPLLQDTALQWASLIENALEMEQVKFPRSTWV